MTTPVNNLPPEETYEAVPLSKCLADDLVWYIPNAELNKDGDWITLVNTWLWQNHVRSSTIVVLRRLPPKPLVDDLYDVLRDLYACTPVGEKKDEIIRVLERYRTEHKRE